MPRYAKRFSVSRRAVKGRPRYACRPIRVRKSYRTMRRKAYSRRRFR